MNNILQINQLEIYHEQRAMPTEHLIHKISFQIPKGKITGIVGESGSGKSLSMKSLLGILPNNLSTRAENYTFEGAEVDVEKPRVLNKLPISMIFQDPMSSLNPVRNIGYHLIEVIQRFSKLPDKEAKLKAIQSLRDVEIQNPEHVITLFPHELSGGMIQRVIIAMALLKNPKLLIADEPTTALDVTVQAQILGLIRKMKQEADLSVILVTHDFGVVAEMCDYIYVMFDGVVVEYGPAPEIFYNPQHPYTKELLKSIPNSTRREKLYVMEPYTLTEGIKEFHTMEPISDEMNHYVVRSGEDVTN